MLRNRQDRLPGGLGQDILESSFTFLGQCPTGVTLTGPCSTPTAVAAGTNTGSQTSGDLLDFNLSNAANALNPQNVGPDISQAWSDLVNAGAYGAEGVITPPTNYAGLVIVLAVGALFLELER